MQNTTLNCIAPAFTAHNIRLDDGTFTKPEHPLSMEAYPRFLSTRRVLDCLFPSGKNHLSLIDLGCLEGGYSVEFARMGFRTVGLEVRDENLAACNYVKSRTNLPNLSFVKDDCWNILKYGPFDVVFCCGLFYHIDQPKKFLETLAVATNTVLIIQTHFSTDPTHPAFEKHTEKFNLSPLAENEGLKGRWFPEFNSDEEFQSREHAKWASWGNRKSFWVQREYLLKTIYDVGFDIVLEQFDNLGHDIADCMLNGYYHTDARGTFIGIKS